MTVKIKICGITCREDAHAAQACGADYIGVIVNITDSRRSVTLRKAAEISSSLLSTVLLMEAPVETINTAIHRIRPHAVQLIGPFSFEDIKTLKGETNIEIWKSIHVPHHGQSISQELKQQIKELHQAGIDALVLDTLVPGQKGGTGQTCDWTTAARIVQSTELPVFLAGGLTPENVAQAITAVKPFGVDVSSGVESSPGRKNLEKVTQFIQQASIT
jgi:phosphoribosylanthranilate isomerase